MIFVKMTKYCGHGQIFQYALTWQVASKWRLAKFGFQLCGRR
jgi:hypothetical protein